jgi:hypothetical protein
MHAVRQSFWEELNETIEQRPNTPLKPTRRVDSENDNWRPQRHLAESVTYSFNLPLRKGEIMVYLIPRRHRDREAILSHLGRYRDQIVARLETPLEWRPSDGNDKLVLRRDADIEANTNTWSDYQHWLIERAENLYFATGPYLAGFDTT